MALIQTIQKATIDSSSIVKGDLIRARYRTWDEARNGVVSGVTPDYIRVEYIPGITNVTSYFEIKADEIETGLWEVRWTHDLQTVEVYPASEGGAV